jgi:hypothetical protein
LSSPNFPQDYQFYTLLAPAADAAGRSSAFLSLKNAIKAWIVVFVDQGNAATIALTPNQASAVAGTGAKVIANARIWTKLDQASADFAQAAEAANFTTDAAVKNKWVVFEIDPTKVLDVANDFDCVRITTGASNAANITSAFLLVQNRHSGATVPSPLAD